MVAKLFEQNRTGMGFTFGQPVIYLNHWLSSWQGDKPLLDIGCGHGINTLQALEYGASVVATDLEQPDIPNHPNLTQIIASLPDQMPFSDHSFSGILCAEVLHFLRNEQVRPTIKKLHRLLQQGGSLLITCISCDIAVLRSTNLSKRIKKALKQNPTQFFGQEDYISLLTEAAAYFADPEITRPVIEAHTHNIPDRNFSFFIAEQLADALKEEGFTIKICEQGPAPHYPVWTHGDRDQVRILANKR